MEWHDALTSRAGPRPRGRLDAVQDATPDGWCIGRSGYEERSDQWSMYAFDTHEKPIVGKRSREWTAVGPTELRCVQEMARCLRELGEGRWVDR